MSDNNLVNIKGMSDEQIMQAIGQDDGSNLGNNIPRLAMLSAKGLNVKDIITYDKVFIEQKSYNPARTNYSGANYANTIKCRFHY